MIKKKKTHPGKVVPRNCVSVNVPVVFHNLAIYVFDRVKVFSIIASGNSVGVHPSISRWTSLSQDSRQVLWCDKIHLVPWGGVTQSRKNVIPNYSYILKLPLQLYLKTTGTEM